MKRDAASALQAAADRSWAGRWRHILERVHLADEAALPALLRGLSTPAARPYMLAFVNAHAMNLAAHRPAFAEDLASADLLLRDGSGMALLLRRQGRSPGANLNGTDFIPRLLAACDGLPVAVLGTREPHLSRGVSVIAQRLMPHSRLQALDGYQPTPRYLELLRAHRPAVVLLAMGMPRQERLARQWREALDFPCLLICGGAIVDFLGGKTRRAPAWLRRLGLEWLWRLGQEPRRLFVRYVVGNPLFLLRAAWLPRRRDADDRPPGP